MLLYSELLYTWLPSSYMIQIARRIPSLWRTTLCPQLYVTAPGGRKLSKSVCGGTASPTAAYTICFFIIVCIIHLMYYMLVWSVAGPVALEDKFTLNVAKYGIILHLSTPPIASSFIHNDRYSPSYQRLLSKLPTTSSSYQMQKEIRGVKIISDDIQLTLI